VKAAIVRHDMLRHGRRLGVAVSGGADSVFLLHALRDLELAAAILHVNHALRGEESERDEAFVRELGAAFGLPVHTARRPVAQGNVEQEARRARYAFFADRIAAGCCDAVATGHTLDDQAETVLSRLIRGAGTAGLSGIRPVTDTGIIRPLIGLRRSEVREWLATQGIGWREDRSNADERFLRNRIRMDVMPRLAELNPALPETLGSMSEWARGEEEYWAAELERLARALGVSMSGETLLMNVEAVAALPVATTRRLLRRSLERVKGSLRGIEFLHIEAIRAMLTTREGSGRLQIPGLDIYRSFDWLRIAPAGFDARLGRDFEVELPVPGRTTLPERQLTLVVELVTESNVYNGERDVLDWGRCTSVNGNPLLLRNWRPGDSYQPAGVSSREKIKTLFQQYRVPLWERRTWPVVAKGDTILWTRRFGVASEFAAGPGASPVLRIREAGESDTALGASKVTGAYIAGAGLDSV